MISVVICTYNGEKYIKEQVASILRQTRQPDEIVVCDDCSGDGTVDIVKDMLENWHGIKKIAVNEKNLGYKKNFEKAIGLSRGDIIFLSDQDDVWHAEKIQKIEAVFKENLDAVLVFHDAALVDEHLAMLYPSFWKTLRFYPRKFGRGRYVRLLEGNVVQGSACAFKRCVYHKAFPFCMDAVHDEWLALAASLEGDLVPVADVLMQYRQAQNAVGGLPDTLQDKRRNYTSNKDRHFLQMMKELKRRACIMDTLVNRYLDDVVKCKTIDYTEYRNFLHLRLKSISEGNFLLFRHGGLYVKFSDTMFSAMKTYVKDFLLLWWNRGKK